MHAYIEPQFKSEVNPSSINGDYHATMIEYWERLQSAMKAKAARDGAVYGIPQLSAALGVSYQAVAKVKNGGSLGKDNNIKAARLLNVSSEWLANGEGEPTEASVSNIEPGPDFNPTRNYPVISSVQAGDWTEICDNFQPGDADEWYPSTFDLGKCGYMLRVTGKSMLDPYGRFSFPPGTLLHVHPDAEPQSGQFVIVRRDGENSATFKRLVEIDGEQFLEAVNPDWPARYLKLQPGDTFCGVVRTATLPDLP